MSDHACYMSLLTAIVVQWLKDAKRNPQEVPRLALFLEVPPAAVLQLAERKLTLSRGG